MPSDAYNTFIEMRTDVVKIIGTYYHYKDNNIKNNGLGYLTRSGIVMLCAAWERYNEDLLLECQEYVFNNINDINLLNMGMKKTLSRLIKESKNELSPIQLGGEGWKDAFKTFTRLKTESVNTPKVAVLDKLYESYLGVENYHNFWSLRNPKKIDDFVSDRGEIAHNGNKSAHMKVARLKKYNDLVVDVVVSIDYNIAELLKLMTNTAIDPWTRLYTQDLRLA